MEFSVESALGVGWGTFKSRPWFFVGSSLVILAAYLLAGFAGAAVDVFGTPETPSLLGHAVDILLGTFIDMSMVGFYLAAHANPETVTLSALWDWRRPFWMFLVVSILFQLAVVVGLVLFIVPGIIALLVFLFAPVIVIDQGLGPIEAMKESMRITRGHLWPLLGLVVLLVLLVFAGIVALFVGVLVAIPVAMLSLVHAYRALLFQAGPRPPEQTLIA